MQIEKTSLSCCIWFTIDKMTKFTSSIWQTLHLSRSFQSTRTGLYPTGTSRCLPETLLMELLEASLDFNPCQHYNLYLWSSNITKVHLIGDTCAGTWQCHREVKNFRLDQGEKIFNTIYMKIESELSDVNFKNTNVIPVTVLQLPDWRNQTYLSLTRRFSLIHLQH